MIARLDDLEDAGLDQPIATRLRRALVEHRHALESGADARDDVVAILREARERVAGWPLEHNSFEALAPGIARVYRRGRRDFRAAAEEPTVESLHEWRKRVKDLWYFLTLLRNAWEPVMEAMADEAHALSERLGDDHDLAVLAEWASARPAELGGAEGAAAFTDLVERCRAELQAEAFAIAARVYGEPPKAFGRRLEAYWRAWREASAGAPA
jgi:CHAD domain-containing protein